MRSMSPVPGNPWPHDMVITVDDQPRALLELLWVREAYGLRVDGDDLPPALVDAPAVLDDVADAARAEWEQAWPLVWRAAAAHAGRDDANDLIAQLKSSVLAPGRRADLLQELFGPSWRDEFGDEVFDVDSYREWSDRGDRRMLETAPLRAQALPERRDNDALVTAWQGGLTKIVTIPCAGEFARRISPSALLTTDATRADSAAYRRALNGFA